MKNLSVAICSIALCAGSSVGASSSDTFGSGTNSFAIEFVEVADAGNAPDITGYGSVSYDYKISRNEITEDQITQALASGLVHVSAGAWSGDQPAAFVTWFDAAAFVNFLNEQAGYPKAYNLAWDENAQTWTLQLWDENVSAGPARSNRFRHRAARYVLASEDEWHKAAFYKGGGTNAGYWAYPTGQATAPVSVAASDQPGTAVFGGQDGPASVNLDGGLSAYGTRGQGGNVAEWLETAWDGLNDSPNEARVVRGGDWFGPAEDLSSAERRINHPRYSSDFIGFRVVKLPEPVFTHHMTAQIDGDDVGDAPGPVGFAPLPLGESSSARQFTILNAGTETLEDLTVTLGGSTPGDFVGNLPPAIAFLHPGDTAEFTVAFAPEAGSDRSAFITVQSSAPEAPVLTFHLHGYGISTDFDKDGDGLNDLAEYLLTSLGFDFETPQPGLVQTLLSNANAAQLFTASQQIEAFNQGLSAGTSAVIADPQAYGLYTADSIMDLNLGGVVLQKMGNHMKLRLQIQSTQDLGQPFTNHGAPVEIDLPDIPQNKGFFRIRALGANPPGGGGGNPNQGGNSPQGRNQGQGQSQGQGNQNPGNPNN